MAGCGIEISQSKTGMHLLGRGTVPPHACKNILLGIELYTDERFVALTDINATGNLMADYSVAIPQIVADYFPHNPHGEIAGWIDEPCEGWDGPKTDDELLKAAMKSGKNSPAAAFGDKTVLFEDLWTANEEALARKWPGDNGGYDASSADMSLASHLAFWTGKNCERIRTLMLQSELARGKWEDRPDYLETTIMKACAVVTNVAKGKPAAPPIDTAKAEAIEMRPPDDLSDVTFDGDEASAPPRELIKGLLPAEGIVFLGGQSGAGKTYIAVKLAVALATPHES